MAQYFLEMDDTELGAGAVLSQRDRSTNQLHPVAFYFKKFSDAERKYDIGNQLLAIKLAFFEWRRWLEGTELPVVVQTDH